MGYDTDICGVLHLSASPGNADLEQSLCRLRSALSLLGTRRMLRTDTLAPPGDWDGLLGELSTCDGQQGREVVLHDYMPPMMQPSLWCDWELAATGGRHILYVNSYRPY
eukprot:m51a1_g8401 hypothetical protein (109) ;mRNA; r:235782-236108